MRWCVAALFSIFINGENYQSLFTVTEFAINDSQLSFQKISQKYHHHKWANHLSSNAMTSEATAAHLQFQTLLKSSLDWKVWDYRQFTIRAIMDTVVHIMNCASRGTLQPLSTLIDSAHSVPLIMLSWWITESQRMRATRSIQTNTKRKLP